MKKAIILLICFVMIMSSAIALNVYANDDIKVVIDNQNQSYDQMPVIVSDRTLVPLRGIFEALGANVDWQDETKTIIGSKGDKTIVLQVGNTTASMNNNKVTLDVPPTIINSRTMVPVRFVSEALGANVDWVADTRTVVIKSSELVQKERTENRLANGEVVLDESELIKRTKRTITNSEGSQLNYVDDKLYVNVKTLPQNDMGVMVTFKAPIGGIVKQSDVCLIKFNARLLSGGDNGTGYIKVWVQNDKSTKPLFVRTEVGKEWTECSLPFIGIANLRDIGFRLGGMVQELEIKDFQLINYGPDKDIKTLKSTYIIEENTVVPTIKEDASQKEEVKAEKEPVSNPSVNFDNIPEDGVVILDNNQLMSNAANITGKVANIKSENGVLKVNVHTLPEKDLTVVTTLNAPLAGLIRQSDVCLMTFKARLVSGGTNGTGYVKAFVQNETSVKSLFVRTNVGSEWTECSLPFVGIANMKNMGFRFGGAVQEIEIKDFKVVNYGNKKNIASLKSTYIIEENTVVPNIKENATQKEETPASKEPSSNLTVNADNIPEGGVVILDNNQFLNNSARAAGKVSTLKVENDMLKADIHTLPEKDLGVTVTLNTPLAGLINQSDVCLMTFKARLVSGGTNGLGYIKAFVQNETSVKALFARTDVGSEWTDCYLPFVGIANMKNMGLRLGGAVQKLEITDFKVINYGNKIAVKDLKTTVLKDANTVAPVVAGDVPGTN